MNREEIIAMALECGWSKEYLEIGDDRLERFADLVASAERERIKQANAPEIERVNAYIKELEDAVKAEREACAITADKHMKECEGKNFGVGRAIRARGQA